MGKMPKHFDWTNISLYEDRYYENNFKPTSREILRFLKTIRESTAIRWFNHWNNGGSVRSLGKKRKIK